MSPRTPPRCEHEIRPGTVVCLHCRHAAHLAEVARRRRRATRVGLALVAVTLVAGGALRALELLATPAAAEIAVRESSGGTEMTAPLVHPVRSAPVARTAPRAVATLAAVTTPTSAAAPFARPAAAPVVAEGRTTLRDGIVAVRSGDTVAVHFDTPFARTRRPEKLERIVRATLPAVWGAVADSALAGLPAGGLARLARASADHPTRPVELRTADGTTLAVWSEARDGRDGPLVVTYRAALR